jgi:hypothetical protein
MSRPSSMQAAHADRIPVGPRERRPRLQRREPGRPHSHVPARGAAPPDGATRGSRATEPARYGRESGGSLWRRRRERAYGPRASDRPTARGPWATTTRGAPRSPAGFVVVARGRQPRAGPARRRLRGGFAPPNESSFDSAPRRSAQDDSVGTSVASQELPTLVSQDWERGLGVRAKAERSPGFRIRPLPSPPTRTQVVPGQS